ncbi:MAG: transferase [Syntrophobacter sp.]
MQKAQLTDHQVLDRCIASLTESGLKPAPYTDCLKIPEDSACTHAAWGSNREHPFSVEVENSIVDGSYFLGKCTVKDSILFHSDIRGDELKRKGEIVKHAGVANCIGEDEEIAVRDSYLFRTLVHSNSHDPENLTRFPIENSVCMHHSNVHGSPISNCLLKPFATIDLTVARDSAVGTYSYVQAGKLNGYHVRDGHVWVKATGKFDFQYTFDLEALKKYIFLEPGSAPRGLLIDFLAAREKEFEKLFLKGGSDINGVSSNTYVHPYAVIKGDFRIGENAFVAQRAFLENAFLGNGANAQENCYIIDSILEGNDVSAHGSKIIETRVGRNVFVGFNSFVRGVPGKGVLIGSGSIIAPHTIIDAVDQLEIPSNHFVWGLIQDKVDLAANSISLSNLASAKGEMVNGHMTFRGDGGAFASAFKHRIEHILEGNGALYDSGRLRGHAQKCRGITFKTVGAR